MNRIGAVAIATICLCSCRHEIRSDADALAERYVRLALAVGARDPDSLDFYAGPADWRRDAEHAYRPLADVRRDLLDVSRQLTAVATDPNRKDFLAGQVSALLTRIDILRGAHLPFADEAARLFGITPPPPDPARAEAVRQRLDHILPGRGDLSTRYAAYARPALVPPSRVPAEFARALAACRAETVRHLPLPPDETISVEYAATASPWSAFTRYAGRHHSDIQVNTAFAFTTGDLTDLACHEAYPGHHTAYVLQDDSFVQKSHRIEFTIEPLFSPQSLLDEATASYAPLLVFPDANPVQRLVASLDLVRLDIVRRYLDGELEFARAASALDHEAVTPASDAVLKFANEFRSYVVTYTAGREWVARAVERAGGDNDARWRAYKALLLAGTLPAPPP